MENISLELNTLLEKCKVQITGRKVACLIFGDDQTILKGFNEEKDLEDIFHAECNALKGARDNFQFAEIHLAADSGWMNVKHAIPCENCTNALAKYAKANSKVVLHRDCGDYFALDFAKIKQAYEPEDEILFDPNAELKAFLKNTFLTEIDQKMVTNLSKFIKSHNTNKEIELYLSGTSSGRGGPKALLNRQIFGLPYWDIDLILITKSKKDTKQTLLDLTKKAFSFALEKCGISNPRVQTKILLSYKLEEGQKDMKNFLFRLSLCESRILQEVDNPHFKKNPLVPSTIDVSVGRTLESTMTTKYLNKKWFIRLL